MVVLVSKTLRIEAMAVGTSGLGTAVDWGGRLRRWAWRGGFVGNSE